MKHFLVIVVVALLVAGDDGYAGAADATADQMDLYNVLSVDIGRLGAINDRVTEAWQELRTNENEKSGYDPAEMNSWLRAEVWHYNGVRESLCNDRYLVKASCGKPFLPAWVLAAPTNVPSKKVLEQRYDELYERVVPLWDAVCVDVKKRLSYEDAQPFCSIE